MICYKCGHNNCSIISETHTAGSDFSATDACCGSILLGPIGLLCGACGADKTTFTEQYYVCNSCGNKFKG